MPDWIPEIIQTDSHIWSEFAIISKYIVDWQTLWYNVCQNSDQNEVQALAETRKHPAIDFILLNRPGPQKSRR
jgi:hypothetical protein